MNFDGIDPTFQKWLDQVADTVNTHSGYNGTVQLADHLDLGGNRIMNIGAPAAPTDAITSGIAEGKYSAKTLKPQLQSGGSQPLDTYRMLNSGSQRESVSSFLNDLPSSVPNANAIFPTLTTSGGSVQVVIPASLFTFSDGSSILLNGRTDLLTLPMQYALTSISVASGVVTAVFSYTGTPPSIAAGNAGTISGVSPSAYNGTFTLISVVINTGAMTVTIEYQDPSAGGAATGGFFQLNPVWYYAAKKRSADIYLLGPYATDSAQNRLNVNMDGYQIVAVVVITNSGGQVSQSGGGGSPIVGSPTAGAFF